MPPSQADAGDNRVYEYAFTSITIDDSASHQVAHTGFNYDDRFSRPGVSIEDCDHGDFFSAIDPDQNENDCAEVSGCVGGVDNQLPEIVGALRYGFLGRIDTVDYRERFRTDIAQGRLALLMRIEGAANLSDDPEVRVSLLLGRPMFSACAEIGRLGRPYAIDGVSLRDGVPRFRYEGAIVHGRLRVHAPHDATPFLLEEPQRQPSARDLIPSRLSLRDLQLRVTLSEREGVQGNLGGNVLARELINVLTEYPYINLHSIVEGMVNGFSDLPFNAVSYCDNLFGGVGVGLGFTLKRATILPDVIDGPAPGTCGSP